MFNQKMHGRGLVLIPFLLALLLLTFMFIVITPSKANQLADIPDRTVQPTTNNHWLTECVDCGKRFSSLTNQSTKLDVGGNPHIVYGGDHLYYTWFDGTKWNYETIDDSPLVGGSAALALDQSGNPHVSYHDRFNHALKYAYHDVNGWHSMIVDQNPGDTGVLTSIALDQSDLPHITYYDVADHMLRYAYFNGTDWQINNIDKGGVYSNIVLDSSGSPHISYESIDHGYLNYAYIGGSGWVTETLDTGDTSSFTSIVLDDSGYPHIGYYDNQSGSLKYAFQDAGGWNFLTLDAGHFAGFYLSLKISPDGNPWMSYYDSPNGDLKVGYLQGSTWVSSTVDSTGNVGGYTSLQFNNTGIAFITYAEVYCVDLSCGAVSLKLAQQSGNDWLIQEVDKGSRAGGNNSLVADSTGTPHLAYIFWQAQALHLGYATPQNNQWLTTDLAGTGQLGDSPNPAMVLDPQGQPRYSYTISTGSLQNGYTPNGLVYAQGITNLITETVDTGLMNGLNSSLALDNQGYPHISYNDAGNLSLKYAYEDNAGWHTDVLTATSLTSDTVHSHLQMDKQGYAHIVYNDVGLHYAYQDQAGWHFTVIDTHIDVRATTLALDADGSAYIAYQRNISSTLNYAYQDQGSWITEVISGAQTDHYISFALNTNKVPYIAYHNITDSSLVLIHRTGSSWTSETVAKDGDVGEFPSLVLLPNGTIYVSYYDATNGDMWFAVKTVGPVTTRIFIPVLTRSP